MTIVMTILNGSRYTLWNVSTLCFTEVGVDIEFTDKPSLSIQGKVDNLKVK